MKERELEGKKKRFQQLEIKVKKREEKNSQTSTDWMKGNKQRNKDKI
jgi:hypothetical protein